MQHRSFLLQLTPDDFRPKAFAQAGIVLVRAGPADGERCRALWNEVGRGYWTERSRWRAARWSAYLRHPSVAFWIASWQVQDIGFFEIVRKRQGTKIEGMGLLPAWRGRGLGGGLLSAATRQALDGGARRVWLHTATDDHPHALSNYLARGYRVYREKPLQNPMPAAQIPQALLPSVQIPSTHRTDPLPMAFPLSPEAVLRTYFQAKDENRPHLVARAFSDTATLEMQVRTGNIAFPAVSHGAAAIADVLVRRFGQAYENVYTFCLDPAPGAEEVRFSCRWLVGMSDKASGQVRVGCGRYGWVFDPAAGGRAAHLTITIEAMQLLPPTDLPAVMDWLGGLAYPWSSAEAVLASAPAREALGPVLQYLGHTG